MGDKAELPSKPVKRESGWSTSTGFRLKWVSVRGTQRTIAFSHFDPRQFVRERVRSRSTKMFWVMFWYFYFVLVYGDLRKMTLPVYTPPSHEEMLRSYFHESEQTEANRTKKSILVTEKVQNTLEVMKKELLENISVIEKELTENTTDGNISEPVRMGVLKNFLTAPIQPTTYRYPTAVWSSQNYEKLKNSQRFRPRNITRIFLRPTLNPAYVYLDRGFKSNRRSRGKTKWKDVTRAPEVIQTNEFVDRFLEQSLDKYLTSSNLRDNVGNVSVKTFSELLKNVTEQKPKRLQSPYDENKELRMKFREEVILKKKNETKPQSGFLEKQLQRRLEKVQDMFNEKDKEKILANMWKYATLNRTIDTVSDRRPNVTEGNISTTFEPYPEVSTNNIVNRSIIYITTEHTTKYSTEYYRGTAKYKPKFEPTENIRRYGYEPSDEHEDDGSSRNLLRAEESVYYRRGHFPRLTFIGQPEKPGIIPGKPFIDYPVHGFPPATKFKCPKFKEGKPRMMADPETRCQVFYICTGDGPTTAMLCPNGTMFNEKYLVCDWWYNVNC